MYDVLSQIIGLQSHPYSGRFIWHDDTPRYVQKRKQGIVFYTKPRRNDFVKAHTKPRFHRRLTTLRVRTHTKK